MIVPVRLFAAARQAVGDETVHVLVDESATIGDLRRAMAQQFPALRTWEPHLLFALDQQFATDDQLLGKNREIAAFPPVSGG